MSNTYELTITQPEKIECDVHFGTLDHTKLSGEPMVVITDSNVFALEKTQKLLGSLVGCGKLLMQNIIVMPAGEEHKTGNIALQIAEIMATNNLVRDTHVVALGGGVVGDIAGFVGACYVRGVKKVTQIPTTQLAKVDSSIGGKTGVDLSSAKNMLGAFRQPDEVHQDAEWDVTLPDVQFRNGLSEAIKTGALGNPELFNFIEKNKDKILNKDPDTLLQMNRMCVETKGAIVTEDFREKARRKTLNFGHTFGHALESCLLELGTPLPHGYCVAVGMIVAGKIAIRENTGFVQLDLDRLKSILKDFSLPTEIPIGLDIDRLIGLMRKDKKNTGGTIQFTLPVGIGAMSGTSNWSQQISEDILKEVIQDTVGEDPFDTMFLDVVAENNNRVTSTIVAPGEELSQTLQELQAVHQKIQTIINESSPADLPRTIAALRRIDQGRRELAGEAPISLVVQGLLNEVGTKARNTIWKGVIDNLYDRKDDPSLVLTYDEKRTLGEVKREMENGKLPVTTIESDGTEKTHRWRKKALELLKMNQIQ